MDITVREWINTQSFEEQQDFGIRVIRDEWRNSLMLTLDVQSILDSIPNEVPWQDIVQFDKLDERVAIANELCSNIIGVNEASIEWCPNDEPPSLKENLIWWWVIRPDLGAAIAIEAPQELKEIIGNYILQN